MGSEGRFLLRVVLFGVFVVGNVRGSIFDFGTPVSSPVATTQDSSLAASGAKSVDVAIPGADISAAGSASLAVDKNVDVLKPKIIEFQQPPIVETPPPTFVLPPPPPPPPHYVQPPPYRHGKPCKRNVNGQPLEQEQQQSNPENTDPNLPPPATDKDDKKDDESNDRRATAHMDKVEGDFKDFLKNNNVTLSKEDEDLLKKFKESQKQQLHQQQPAASGTQHVRNVPMMPGMGMPSGSAMPPVSGYAPTSGMPSSGMPPVSSMQPATPMTMQPSSGMGMPSSMGGMNPPMGNPMMGSPMMGTPMTGNPMMGSPMMGSPMMNRAAHEEPGQHSPAENATQHQDEELRKFKEYQQQQLKLAQNQPGASQQQQPAETQHVRNVPMMGGSMGQPMGMASGGGMDMSNNMQSSGMGMSSGGMGMSSGGMGMSSGGMGMSSGGMGMSSGGMGMNMPSSGGMGMNMPSSGGMGMGMPSGGMGTMGGGYRRAAPSQQPEQLANNASQSNNASDAHQQHVRSILDPPLVQNPNNASQANNSSGDMHILHARSAPASANPAAANATNANATQVPEEMGRRSIPEQLEPGNPANNASASNHTQQQTRGVHMVNMPMPSNPAPVPLPMPSNPSPMSGMPMSNNPPPMSGMPMSNNPPPMSGMPIENPGMPNPPPGMMMQQPEPPMNMNGGNMKKRAISPKFGGVMDRVMDYFS